METPKGRQILNQLGKKVTSANAVLITVLGLSAIIGWHARIPLLFQVRPSFAPMQYNTALCFVGSGLGLLGITLRLRWLSLPAAALVCSIASLTLVQYITDRSFGIDQFFIKPYVTTMTSHPGRMSLFTTISFLMSGLAIISAASNVGRRNLPMIGGLLSSIVLALSMLGIVGYLAGLTGAFSWTNIAQMALPTVYGFLLLGVGLFATAWRDEVLITKGAPRWLPYSVSLIALTTTSLLGNALRIRENEDLAQDIRVNSAIVQTEIVSRLESRFHALERMARRWEFSGTPVREAWEDDATQYIQDGPGYEFIAWADPDLVIRWAVSTEQQKDLDGLEIEGELRDRLSVEFQRNDPKKVFTSSLDIYGDGTIIVAPIREGDSFQGCILAALEFKSFLDATLPTDLAPGYNIEVLSAQELIYKRETASPSTNPDWISVRDIRMEGVDWVARVSPGAALISTRHSFYWAVVVCLGGFTSLLLGISVTLSQKAIRQSETAMARNLRLRHEVTERKRSQDELQKMGSLHQAIVTHSAYSVITTTPQGTITSFNPAAERMLGYTAAEVVGSISLEPFHDLKEVKKRAEELSKSFNESIDPGFRVFVEEARRGIPSKHEWTYIRKDGSRFPVTLDVTALHDPTGKIIGFLGIASDISELKHSEKKLKETHEELLLVSLQAGRAEVATNVLHNVGNVLNSVNVSCSLLSEKVRRSPIGPTKQTAELLKDHSDNLADFVANDRRGRELPGFLEKLAAKFADDQIEILRNLETLENSIAHIKEIVAMQQGYSKVSGVSDSITAEKLVETALRMSSDSMIRHSVDVEIESIDSPVVTVEIHKAVQILVNLLNNAKNACQDNPREVDNTITMRITSDDENFQIDVIDNGMGIDPKNLTRIFAHGFTTRKDGHGFGLHSSALAAKEMGGTLTAASPGIGSGATFTLVLPIHPASPTPESA